MDKRQADEILDYLRRIDESVNGSTTKTLPGRKRKPLSDRVDSLSDRVDSISDRVDTVSDRVDSLDAKVDALDTRMGNVELGLVHLDRKIDGVRTELVDHMERIHEELAGRIIDLEAPGHGGRGGGPGVPLAS
jgi:RNAse (barnase) inhibitor barstar